MRFAIRDSILGPISFIVVTPRHVVPVFGVRQFNVGALLGENAPTSSQKGAKNYIRFSAGTGSSRNAMDTDRVRNIVGSFYVICHCVQGQRICLCLCFFFGSSIRHGAWNFGDLSDPAAIFLALNFKLESQVSTPYAAR